MAPVESTDQSRPWIRVEVAFSPEPRRVELVSLVLPAGSIVQDALAQADLLERLQGWSLGIWGRRSTLTQTLKDHDRVEAYRGLVVDPKEARRVRYRAHGEKLPKGRQRPKVNAGPDESAD